MSFYLDSFHCLFHSVEDGQIEVRGASLPCSHSSHLSGRDQIGKRKFVHTMFVPYSIACLEWKVPCFPVKPWQLRKIFWKVFKQDAPGLFFSPGIWPCSPCWATCLVESECSSSWLHFCCQWLETNKNNVIRIGYKNKKLLSHRKTFAYPEISIVPCFTCYTISFMVHYMMN